MCIRDRNEGQALLITKTKGAEAEGNAIKIAAEAEREAARLRGMGVALFRQEVAKGMSQAAEEMKQANLDTNVISVSYTHLDVYKRQLFRCVLLCRAV